MYHSITFGEKNTWDDWHLIPVSRPLFNPPQVKTSFVDIPGGDGIIDLTEALSGRPLYKNRTGSIEFAVANDYEEWFVIYSNIMNYLQGKVMRAILEDEPDYYYEGRFQVNAWKSDKNYSRISIEYNVSPYKYSIFGSLDDWLWHTFNFETGIIRYYKNLQVNGTLTINVVGMTMPTPLNVTSSRPMKVEQRFDEDERVITASIPAGTSVIQEIIFYEGNNYLTFIGNGTISIDFRGGIL